MPRAYVPAKRLKAKWRTIGPAHPWHGSLKQYARAAAADGTSSISGAAHMWLDNKAARR